MITKSDKGNVTVIMDKSDYEKKIMAMVSDPKVYKCLGEKDPTHSVSVKNNDLVNKIKTLDMIEDKLFEQLFDRNGVPPRLYGLPKHHKPDLPLRPITSFVNSPLYNTS